VFGAPDRPAGTGAAAGPVATTDGSFGARGPVTGLMEQIIREARTDVIYACAPVPVLREVAGDRRPVRHPGAGVGGRADGVRDRGLHGMRAAGHRDRRDHPDRALLRDGPVFRADLVRWDDVGTIPFDALGAPGLAGRPGPRNHAMPADMRARLGQTDLPNLVLSASGCAGAGRELAPVHRRGRVGAVISKSIMAEPHTGNPAPRLAETPSGLLNSVGLQGPGLDAFLQRDLPWLLSRGARVVVSIRRPDHPRVSPGWPPGLSDTAGVSAIEVNLSCPQRGRRRAALRARPAAGRQRDRGRAGSARYDIPVFAKLSPDVTDIVGRGQCLRRGRRGTACR